MNAVSVTPEITAAKAAYAHPDPVAEFMVISPDVARHMLLANTHNRASKPLGINRLTYDLRKNDWHITNQGIGFRHDGTLIDGQNRLLAIIETGVTVKVLVVRGLDDQAQSKVDRHSRRTLAESLLLSEDSVVAGRICEAARANLIARMKNPSPPDALVAQYIRDHFDALEWASEVFRRRVRGVSRAPVLAACAEYREHNPDLPTVEEFARGLLDPTSIPEVSPIRLLREWLVSNAFAFSAENGAILVYQATKTAAVHHWLRTPLTTIDARHPTEWPQ